MVTFGVPPGCDTLVQPTINKSDQKSLALLYACRQIYNETRSLWKQCVLFNFQTPEAMLDILSPLPDNIISQIRRARTSGRPIKLGYLCNFKWYRTVSVTKLLPALRLDTFTVLGGSSLTSLEGLSPIQYASMDELIEYGNGWKELRYIASDSAVLGHKKCFSWGRIFDRKPQPTNWNEKICKRDGVESGASVTIYRSTIAKPGAIIDFRHREVYRKDVSAEDTEFGQANREYLTAPAEKDREMMIVVKRGKNASILENRELPYDEDHDIREWAKNMTWDKIRKKQLEGKDVYSHIDYDQINDAGETLDTYGRNANSID